jgi:homeobox-leucine zipper protein
MFHIIDQSIDQEGMFFVCQIRELREKVEKQMAVKLESVEDRQPLPAPGAAVNTVYKDGSTDSDSSAVFNEEASPYSAGGAAPLDHHTSFTGFTSFLASSSALSSSFPSMYSGSPHLDQETDCFLGAVATTDGFFAEEQDTGLGSWYGSEGW